MAQNEREELDSVLAEDKSDVSETDLSIQTSLSMSGQKLQPKYIYSALYFVQMQYVAAARKAFKLHQLSIYSTILYLKMEFVFLDNLNGR